MRELDIASDPSCLLCGLGMNGEEIHGGRRSQSDDSGAIDDFHEKILSTTWGNKIFINFNMHVYQNGKKKIHEHTMALVKEYDKS